MYLLKNNKAFSTIELLVSIAILSVALIALILSLSFVIKLNAYNLSFLTANNIADNWVEKIKAMKYSDVGIVSGDPQGLLQNSYNELHGSKKYNVFVQVYWIDDPKDGLESLDIDSNVNDYKAVKLTVSWSIFGNIKSITRYFYVFSQE